MNDPYYWTVSRSVLEAWARDMREYHAIPGDLVDISRHPIDRNEVIFTYSGPAGYIYKAYRHVEELWVVK